ncbi:MAG: glycosyltransferase family 4 protein [Candidatus Helarchaeota archaeon]
MDSIRLLVEMKLVMFSRGIYPPDIGGQEIYTGLLRDFFERNGLSVQVFVRKSCFRSSRSPGTNGIFFLNLPVIRFISLVLSYFWNFIKVNKRGLPSLMVANDVLAEGFSAALIKKFFKIPLIITTHGGGLYRFSKTFGFITKWILSQADRVIAPNQFLRHLALVHVARPEKIIVIPHGIVRAGSRSISQKDSRRLKQKLGVKTEFVMSCVARLVPIKAVDVVIKALELIVKDGIDISLLIIGDGPERKKLKKMVKKLRLDNSVFFLGALPPWMLKDYHDLADVLLLTSKNEGVGLVLLEGMARGIPIIATRVGGIPELIFPGRNGYLVDVGDHEQVARHVKDIVNDPSFREKVKLFDDAKIRRDHDLRKNFSRYLEIFKSLS